MRSLYSGLAMLALILALALGSVAPARGDEEKPKPKPIGATVGESGGWTESIYDPEKHDQIRVIVKSGQYWVITESLTTHLRDIESRLDETNGQLRDLSRKIAAQSTVGFVSGIAAAGIVIGLLFLLLQRVESQ